MTQWLINLMIYDLLLFFLSGLRKSLSKRRSEKHRKRSITNRCDGTKTTQEIEKMGVKHKIYMTAEKKHQIYCKKVRFFLVVLQ